MFASSQFIAYKKQNKNNNQECLFAKWDGLTDTEIAGIHKF